MNPKLRKLMLAAFVPLFFSPTAMAQADWPAYGNDAAAQRYSELKQIDRKNVGQLRVAWTYDTGFKGKSFETTPIVVNDVMYFTTPMEQVIALHASTGQEIWKFDPQEPTVRVNRGVSYWPGDRQAPPRILLGTSDGRLIALDAKTGFKIDSFGEHGQIDLKKGVTNGYPRANYWVTSPPAIFHNLAILAPATQEGPSRGPTGDGDPRAFDIRTGEEVWRFHSMPRPGELGNDTWGGPDGWKDRSGPSAWTPITVDLKGGVVFVATGNPADSYYGADRHGQNLFSNSIVALDASTGKMLWYFQLVHHDLWDYDTDIAPALLDVHREGKTIPAVAGLTKSGLLFILDRTTGKPIFGMEERPVPKSDVPGEETWPTQPFPIKPPPLVRNQISASDLTKVTPGSAQACEEIWSHAHNDGPYTPFGLTPTVSFPAAVGGANWGGVSLDPKLGYVFVNTSELGTISQMAKTENGLPMPYRSLTPVTRFVDRNGYPCQQPPWGFLTAVNANNGEIAWRVPLGNYDDIVSSPGSSSTPLAKLPDGPGKAETEAACSTCHTTANFANLRLSKASWTEIVDQMVTRGMYITDSERTVVTNYLSVHCGSSLNAPDLAASRALLNPSASVSGPAQEPTGTPNLGGSVVTAGGLIFIGATLDNKFRAFDARTGEEVWSTKLDGVGLSGPMTFRGNNGKQYVAIAVGGPGSLRAVHNNAGESPNKIVAFTLP